MNIMKDNRSIVVALDVDTKEQAKRAVEATCDVEGIGGYKLGLDLALGYGLPDIVGLIKTHTSKTIIYDHQKAGTDIPAMGKKFAKRCKGSGVDAVILFPQAGPATEYEWIKACQEEELGVIVGGEMTHPRYLYHGIWPGDVPKDKYFDIFPKININPPAGGFIREDAPEDMYTLAANMGVTNFVVPGNKPERIKHFRTHTTIATISNPTFYAPGFIAQGGDITEGAKAAGERFHAIVGRGIYNPNRKDDILSVTVEEMHEAAKQMTSQII